MKYFLMLKNEINLLYRYYFFFAAEFIYENSFLLCVLQYRLFYNHLKFIFNMKTMKKNVTITIPTVIN